MDYDEALEVSKKAARIANDVCFEIDTIMRTHIAKYEPSMQVAIILTTLVKFATLSLLQVNDSIVTVKFNDCNSLEEHKTVVFQEIDKLLKAELLH